MSSSRVHPLDEQLERVVDVGESGITRGRARRVGGVAPGPTLMPMRSQHELRLVLGHGRLERDVARGEPHLLVAAFVFEAGLVACVRFVEAAVEVHHRSAVDVLDEEPP